MYLRSVNNKIQTYDAIYHKGVAGNAKGFPQPQPVEPEDCGQRTLEPPAYEPIVHEQLYYSVSHPHRDKRDHADRKGGVPGTSTFS